MFQDNDTNAVSSERKQGSVSDESVGYSPDARLVCFMTGILLSEPVKKQLSDSEYQALVCGLFEGWCVGLLSASAPWRMICATTAAGILNMFPAALIHVTNRIPVVARFFSRLESTVSRRVWAERAAVPVCSKYSQALIELLTSVKRALRLCGDSTSTFVLNAIRVDAATPLPFTSTTSPQCESWEWHKGWICSNEGWEVWTGKVELMAVEWKAPQRSTVRTLMDGGEGPPFLGVGGLVMRGVDWTSRNNAGNEDGQDIYEKDKLEMEVIAEEEAAQSEEKNPADDADPDPADDTDPDPADDDNPESPPKPSNEESADKKDKKSEKKRKATKPKLPVGTVIGIESWNGVPAMARRVKWHLTGEEGVYRYGGDGGRFDIAHIEVNEKETRIKKRHPLPESMEQIASRYGFGQRRTCNVILRLDCPARGDLGSDFECGGILEWPDFGAGIQVECVLFGDGAVSITEKKLLYGSKDSGWEARFGE